MKYRMHKRVETKPDGRKIYYYTFEPAAQVPQETPTSASAVPLTRDESPSDDTPTPAGAG